MAPVLLISGERNISHHRDRQEIWPNANVTGHGKWLPWLKAEFGWEDQTARNFIAVHALIDNPPNFGDFRPACLGCKVADKQEWAAKIVKLAILDIAFPASR
jgi:hypothetical protein